MCNLLYRTLRNTISLVLLRCPTKKETHTQNDHQCQNKSVVSDCTIQQLQLPSFHTIPQLKLPKSYFNTQLTSLNCLVQPNLRKSHAISTVAIPS
jgi:hypothetical protein